MRTKKNLLGLILASVFLFAGYSCSTSTSDYLSEMEVRRMIEEAIRENNQKLEFTNWKIVNVNVQKDQWKWNEKSSQYEAVANLPELTKFIYENGAALGYILLGEQNKNEVQKPLPYVNTYTGGNDANGNPIIFTETISCDFQLGDPSTVAFFIKSSDLYKDPEAPQSYNFRVVLIW